MKTTDRNPVLLTAACLVACCLGAVAQEEGTGYRTKDSDWKWVDKLEYRSSSDTYIFQKKGVQGDIPRASVVDLAIPKPADFDKLASQIQASGDAGAVAAMENIVERYAMLKWDVEGLRLLVPTYLRKRDFDKVYKACSSIRRTGAALPEVLLSAYWESLREKNMIDMLKKEVQSAIETGSRPSAAVAYVARGDLLKKEGKKQDALIQGYLRTILCCPDIRAIQPEALFKAYKTLKEMNDPRADRMKRKLLDEYPESSYAKQT